jgi:large subunit ribosomal protein L27
MSHVKSGGAVTISTNVAGKRLGVKKFAGQKVIIGNIIVKQRGSTYHPGKMTKMGNDFSIYAVGNGVVKFRRMTGFKRNQYYVDVIPE